MTELSPHPIALAFPEFEREDFEALKTDIKANGLQVPIELYHGQILDGRNRYRACQELGIEPQMRSYDGGDPLGHAVSLNLKRRHLTESQRSVLAQQLLPLLAEQAAQRKAATQAKAGDVTNPAGSNQHQSKPRMVTAPVRSPSTSTENNDLVIAGEEPNLLDTVPEPARGPTAAAQAAKMVGVSPRIVEQVARVARVAPDLIPKMQTGEISAKEADATARARQREQAEQQRKAAMLPSEIERQEDKARLEKMARWVALRATATN